MTFYCGPQQDDLKPSGGGKFNKDNVGHEAFNFLDVRGRLYGYFQPTVRKNIDDSSIALERIDVSATKIDQLSGVLVIFFAKLPSTGGQAIVGWYRDATVYRHFQRPSRQVAGTRMSWYLNLEAPTATSVLLPINSRPLLVRGASKSDRPGQANLFYPLAKKKGARERPSLPWVLRALRFVETYNGDNLLTNREANALGDTDDMEDRFEAAIAGAEAQGWESDQFVRKRIEEHAMKRAIAHFEERYEVDNVSVGNPYDLSCIGKRSGIEELRVEVKGTRSKGHEVFLTRNEVKSAQEFASCLFVLHSIKVKGRGRRARALGGTPHITNPWKIRPRSLHPLTFTYSVPSG